MTTSQSLPSPAQANQDAKYARWITQGIVALCVCALFSLFGAFQYAFEIATATFPFQKIFNIMWLLGMAAAAHKRILLFSVVNVLAYSMGIYYFWSHKGLTLTALIFPQGELPIGDWLYLGMEGLFMFFFVRSMIAHFYFEAQRTD